MRTNCVNCGGAIDINEIKCPYCGTTYFDLTAIDFASNVPTVLKLRIPTNEGNYIVSMLAKPELGTIEDNQTTQTIRGIYGEPVTCFTKSRNVTVALSFHAVQPTGKQNQLYNIRKDLAAEKLKPI